MLPIISQDYAQAYCSTVPLRLKIKGTMCSMFIVSDGVQYWLLKSKEVQQAVEEFKTYAIQELGQVVSSHIRINSVENTGTKLTTKIKVIDIMMTDERQYFWLYETTQDKIIHLF